MPSDTRLRGARDVRPEIMVTAAFSIQRDFGQLVESLGRTIDMVDSCDDELMERLANTKAAAERGLRLSKLLLKAARRRRL